MPIFIPDRLKSPGDFPSIDANDNQIRGFGFFDDNAARTALSEDFRCEGYLAFMKDTDQFKQYNNAVVDNDTWGNDSNWVLLEGQQTDTYWSVDGDVAGIYYSNQVIVGASTYGGAEKFYVSGDSKLEGSLEVTSHIVSSEIRSTSGIDFKLDTDGDGAVTDDFVVKYNDGDDGYRSALDISPSASTPAIQFGNNVDSFDFTFLSSSYARMESLSASATEVGFHFVDGLEVNEGRVEFGLRTNNSFVKFIDGNRRLNITPHLYKIATAVEGDSNVTGAVEMLMPDSATGDWTFNHLGNKDYVFNTNTGSSSKLITKFHAFGDGVVSIGTANYYNEYNGIQYPTHSNSLQPRLFIVNDGMSGVGIRVQSGDTTLGAEGERTQGRHFTDISDSGFFISRTTTGPVYDETAAEGEEWDGSGEGNPSATCGISRGANNGNGLNVVSRSGIDLKVNDEGVFEVLGGATGEILNNHGFALSNHSASGTPATMSVYARPDGTFDFISSTISRFLQVFSSNTVGFGEQAIQVYGRGIDSRVKSFGNPSSNTVPPLQVYSLLGKSDNTGYWWGADGGAYDTQEDLEAAGTTVDASKLADQVAIYVPKHGSGRVGIGTTDPRYGKLDVFGRIVSDAGENTLPFWGYNMRNSDDNIIGTVGLGLAANNIMVGGFNNGSVTIARHSADGTFDDEIMGHFNSTGLGLGTTDPSYKLHVVGTAFVSSTLTVGNNAIFGAGSSGTNFIQYTRPQFQIRPLSSASVKGPTLNLGAAGSSVDDNAIFTISGGRSTFESSFVVGSANYFGFQSPRSSGWIQTNPAKALSANVTDNTNGDVDTQFWSTLQGVANNNMTLLSSGRLKLGSGGTSFNMPSSDGSPGYILKTNGSGDVSWDANSGFDTVAEMKAASLSPGDLVATQGYSFYGDGGGMFYEIKPSSDGLTDDGGSVITLDNGHFAEAIISGPVTPLAWGLKINDSDSSVATANTTALNNMFSYVGDSVSSSTDATVSVLFPGGLIYINGEVKLPIGSDGVGTLRSAVYVIDFNGSKVVGLDTGSPYTMFARRKTDLDQARFGSVQSSSGVDYMAQRIKIMNGSIQGPNRAPGMTLLRIDCTYNSFVEQMSFKSAEYGLRMHFCLNARVQNNLYGGLNYGLYLSHGDWSGATTSNSACNVSQVFQDRHFCTYPSKSAITVRGSSGVKLTDCIVEGHETEVGIDFQAFGGTTVKDFTIDGLHLEVADSGSLEGVTRAAIRIDNKQGGETTIQRMFAQYDYRKFEWGNRLTKSNTSSATEGTYTLSQDDGDLTTDGDGTGLVMKVVVNSSGNISGIDLAGDPDRSWGFAAGDTVTIPSGKLGASSTEASFEIRRGDVKEHGVLQNKVPMYDAPRCGSYGRIHIGEVYNVGSFISTQNLWPNIGGGTHFASGANSGNRNSTLYDAVTKYGRHAIAYDNPYWVALNIKGVGFDSQSQTTSTTSGLVDGYYILKQSDGDFTTDGSGQGLILRFHVEDGAISYWDVGGQGASGGNAGLSNTSNLGLSQATNYAGGDVITIPANALGTGSSQFTITITNDSKLSNGVPEFGFSRTPYYAYFNAVHGRGSSRNTGIYLSGGSVSVNHNDANAGITVGSNYVKNYFSNSWSVTRRTGYSNGSAGDSGSETEYLALNSSGVLSLNQQDYRNTAAGKGLIVTTPDNTKRYRIAVDNDGNLSATFHSNV